MGLERSVFIPIPKKGNAEECSNYCTIALILHASKEMLKILQARLQQYMNCELPDVQAGFRKSRRTRDQIATSAGSSKKHESSRKISISALLTMPKSLDCLDHKELWEILEDMGVPDHLTCVVRNLYVGQESTVRTRHGSTDWFQIGKGVHQSCNPAYLTSIQSTSCKMPGWMKLKLELRLPGEVSTTSDMQMMPS